MSPATEVPSPEDRAPTGVPGLDKILNGGLPANKLYLVKGVPGTGKTTLAMQFLMEGVRRGETALYITLSETREEIEIVARSHGWDLTGITLFEFIEAEEKLRSGTDSSFFHPSEMELTRTTEILLGEVERVGPARVVFDSLSEFRLLAEAPLRYRRQILRLKQHFAGRKITVLFLDDGSDADGDQHIESIVHGVINLQRSHPDYGATRRKLVVEKLRGSPFTEGHHDLALRSGGLTVFHRLIAEDHEAEGESTLVPSSIPELDALLGGGLHTGTSTMFMGPPGTGKSTMAVRFAITMAQRGEKSLLLLFDENPTILLRRTTALGISLRPFIDNGMITLRSIDPAATSPGEVTQSIVRAVNEDNVRLVAIDSINGYLNAMAEIRLLNLQLHELLTFLARRSVLTLFVLSQQGMMGSMQTTVDLSYLADTVILSRYFEAFGAVKLALSVIKMRSSDHERTIREYRFAKGGVELGEPLKGMQGVLTGVPTFISGSDSLLPPFPKRPQ
ncbi:MAG TPA: ATPase domain-containing protein [Prosthecobacter sp.]